jgi:hypothetical protein
MVYKCCTDRVCVIVSQTALLLSACDSLSHCSSAVCTYFHLWWSLIVALTTSIVSRVSYVHSWCTYLCQTDPSSYFQWSIGRSQLLQCTVCHSIVLQKWRKWKLLYWAVPYNENHRIIVSDLWRHHGLFSDTSSTLAIMCYRIIRQKAIVCESETICRKDFIKYSAIPLSDLGRQQ